MRYMLTLPVIAMAGIVIACGDSSSTSFTNSTAPTATTIPTPPLPPLACNIQYWDPVYNKPRLIVYSMCEHESGRVFFVQINRDGDVTIHLLPDSNRLMAPGNINLDNGVGNPPCGPNGCLMFEITCQGLVTQSDALGTCAGFKGVVLSLDELPKPGDRIEIAGPHVLDNNPDHKWNEIHGGVFRIIERLLGASSFHGIPRGLPHFSLTDEDDDR